MCLHVFAPGNRLELDYVSESNTLEKGGSEDLIEMLVTNHSTGEIDRIHIVYPHAIPNFPLQMRGDKRTFVDLTDTWADPNSRYNLYYKSTGILHIAPPVGGEYSITVQIRNPKAPTNIVPYNGVVRGRQRVTRFETKGARLNDEEWRVLSALGWSVFTVHFDSPIKPQEARWLRLLGRGGRRAENRLGFLEHLYRKFSGMMLDRFAVASPLDVKDRITFSLRTANLYQPRRPKLARSLFPTVEKVLTLGIDAPGTDTVVKDWRINIFWKRYRQVSDPVLSGDIVASPGENWIQLDDGTAMRCFQYKGGTQNIGVATNSGKFIVSVRAQDIPLWIPLLPWISLVLSLVSIGLSIWLSRH